MYWLANHKIIAAIVIVVLGVGTVYVSTHHSQPPTSNLSAISAVVENQKSTQAPVSNQQTKEIQSSLKAFLQNEFTQPDSSFPHEHYAYAYPWPATTVRYVYVAQETDGSYDLHVEFNASPDSNSLYGGIGIYSDMLYIYYPVYAEFAPQHHLNINSLSATEWSTETNKYGNTIDAPLVTTSISKSDSDQVNWQSGDLGGVLEGLLSCTGRLCANTAPGPATP